jgi:hypothetical protein
MKANSSQDKESFFCLRKRWNGKNGQDSVAMNIVQLKSYNSGEKNQTNKWGQDISLHWHLY